MPCFIDTHGSPALSWIEVEEKGLRGRNSDGVMGEGRGEEDEAGM